MRSRERLTCRLRRGQRGHVSNPSDDTQRSERIARYRLFLCLFACLPTLLAAPWALSAPRVHAQAGTSFARGWQHVLPDAPGFTAKYAQLVAGGPGLLAFAPGDPDTPTRLWASADGRAWRLLPPLDFGPGYVADSIFAAGNILVITGSSSTGSNEPRVPHIWASQDGGTTWHESPAHLSFSGLGAGGDGLVAFSVAEVSHPIGVWTSADGLQWRQLPQPPGVFSFGSVGSIVRGVHGLVAGGTAVDQAAHTVRAGIWTSADGYTWTQAPNDHGIFGTGSDGLSIGPMVAGPQGIVAVGEQLAQVYGLVLWASPDGVHWRREPAPFSEPKYSFGQTLAWQGGFIHFSAEAQISGNLHGETAVWSSSDGLTWTRMGSDELFGGTAQVTGAAAFQGGLVAVGSFALHPQPACLRNREEGLNDLRTFQPAAFLWSPGASATAPPLTTDPLDPRALKLLPSDLAAVQNFDVSSFTDSFGAYVNLCAADPALGLHRAYRLSFFNPDPFADGSSYADTALSIVTRTPQAARTGFPFVGRLLGFDLGTIQHKRALPPRVRIGTETRLFQLTIRFWEPPNPRFTQFAVEWRKGRVIGVVEAATRHEAIMLGKRQFAHLKHR